ncbi:MAG: hypothetical protein Q9M17_02300 [Mariprofundus sp.]|nr:hypothetical protein [Mariprofundus sp.]
MASLFCAEGFSGGSTHAFSDFHLSKYRQVGAIGFSIWGLIPGYAIYNYGKAGFQAELLQYFLAGVVLNIAFTIFIGFHTLVISELFLM